MKQDYRHLFNIEPGYNALNHGSFGACPKAILEYRLSLMNRMESLTTRFFMMELKTLIIESLNSLADFIKAPAEDIVFARNATSGVSSVINSIPWEAGDEIITTNLIYESCANILEHLSQTKGVLIHTAEIPFPPENSDSIIDKIFELVTDKTKLIFTDHISSTTGMIMPVETIIAKARNLGIETFIDGAHAPGMLPLDILKLKPDYYTGNCHKWLCSPKGAAFLYVKPEKQHLMKPPVISNYYNKGDTVSSKFFNSFYWQGTMDYTSFLCVKPVIEYIERKITGGWASVMERNRLLALKGRDIIVKKLGLKHHTPESMTGSMVAFRTNTKADIDPETTLDTLYYHLLNKHKIEVVFPPLNHKENAAGLNDKIKQQTLSPERLLRISAHLYNKISDYEKLADALIGSFP